MSTYRTMAGDMVDAIAARMFGPDATGMTERIMDMNRGLAEHGPVLPAGLLITLPPPPGETVRQPVRLWS